MIEKIPFPRRSLTEDEIREVKAMLGSPRVTRPNLNSFMTSSAISLKGSDAFLSDFLRTTIKNTSERFEKTDNETARRLFLTGTLLYGGIYMLTNQSVLPRIEVEAKAELLSKSPYEIMEQAEVVRHSGFGFNAIVREVEPILDAAGATDILFVGAGALHLALWESDRVSIENQLEKADTIDWDSGLANLLTD